MVLVALLFLPCMVVVTTVALPLLLFVIAVIAIPILLYYDRSNIMQKFIIENVCAYTSGEGSADFSSVSLINVSMSAPPTVGIRTSSDRFVSEINPDRASISTSSSKQKKVTFQVCSDHSQSNAFADQQQEQATFCGQSSRVCPTESLIYRQRRQSLYHFYSRGATPITDIRYQNALKQHRPEQMYHHSICVR